jgi:hypothetical protein
VLGKGVLPKQPVIVKARFFSRRAEEKIKVTIIFYTGTGTAIIQTPFFNDIFCFSEKN